MTEEIKGPYRFTGRPQWLAYLPRPEHRDGKPYTPGGFARLSH